MGDDFFRLGLVIRFSKAEIEIRLCAPCQAQEYLEILSMLKIAVLDDYDDSISRLQCWEKLRDRFEVQFFNRPVHAEEISSFDVIVANRERSIIDQKFICCISKFTQYRVEIGYQRSGILF